MMDSTMHWPRPLTPAAGPMAMARIDGAVAGMGRWGTGSRSLVEDGLVPPDLLTGLTLFLLANQPRDPDRSGAQVGGAGGVAGGVWVHERFAIHRPLACGEPFRVSGAALGRHVRRGRRYSTTGCETHNEAGELVAVNLTTGLLGYRPDDGLAESVEGTAPDALADPPPVPGQAAANPCREALAAARVGDVLADGLITVSLELMRAREGTNPDNPIHSDPEAARQAGLDRPIAGGSHVLAFALEPIMARYGAGCLLYGTSFDVRWKVPVAAGAVIAPTVTVVAVTGGLVCLDAEVCLESGATAMVARLLVPY